MSSWVRAGLGHDIHRLHNVLIMRMCAQNQRNYWPLLIDPDNQAPKLIKITHSTTKCKCALLHFMTTVNASHLFFSLRTEINLVILTNFSSKEIPLLHNLPLMATINWLSSAYVCIYLSWYTYNVEISDTISGVVFKDVISNNVTLL